MKKYYFAVNGKVMLTKEFASDYEAFSHRCDLERKDHQNWKVYDERFDLVYGLVIVR